MKKILFIILSILCTIQIQAQSNVIIKGKILNNHFSEAKLQISYQQNASKIAVAKINKKGEFLFRIDTFYNSDIYQIVFSDKENFSIPINPNDRLSIVIDSKDMNRFVSFTGSNSAAVYTKGIQIIDSANVAFDNLKKSNTNNEDIRVKQQNIAGKAYQDIQSLITQNQDDIAVLLFLDIFPDVSNYQTFVKKTYLHLSQKYPNNEYIQKKSMPTPKDMHSGPAPDIALPNPDGEIVKLSSLKGKIVLIDFWASWCGPCRRENPNVVKLYQKYKDSGFEIYSVSLDKDKTAWTNAIKNDELTWTHVSDLKFWSSEGAKLYGVSSIPHTVLVDKDGNIIARNLRGSQLDDKLKEIFGF